MATSIVIDPRNRPSQATLKDLAKQAFIVEGLNTNAGASQLAAVRRTWQRAIELWPVACALACACLANDSSFSGSALDALKETDAP